MTMTFPTYNAEVSHTNSNVMKYFKAMKVTDGTIMFIVSDKDMKMRGCEFGADRAICLFLSEAIDIINICLKLPMDRDETVQIWENKHKNRPSMILQFSEDISASFTLNGVLVLKDRITCVGGIVPTPEWHSPLYVPLEEFAAGMHLTTVCSLGCPPFARPFIGTTSRNGKTKPYKKKFQDEVSSRVDRYLEHRLSVWNQYEDTIPT